MDTVTQKTMTMADMPLGPDGLIDFRALAVGLVEQCVNAVMDLAADELLGEGTSFSKKPGGHFLQTRNTRRLRTSALGRSSRAPSASRPYEAG